MNKNQLKKYLQDLDKASLEKEIMKLFEKFNQVNDFYTAELSEDTQILVSRYKERIAKEFKKASQVNSNSYRTAEINAIIKEFEKIATFSTDVIDLKLYRLELSFKLIKTFGIYEENYFVSIAGHLSKTLKQIETTKQFDFFEPRVKHVCALATDYGIYFQHNTKLNINKLK